MSKGKHSKAEMIAALKQMEAGRWAPEVGREMGVSKRKSENSNTEFPDLLGNPANNAGFPLSRNLGCY